MPAEPLSPCNEVTIPDDVILHRLVPRLQIVEDERVAGGWRPSTNAFKKGTRRGRTDRMSVYLDDTLVDQFRSPDEYIDDGGLIGSPARIKERFQPWASCGLTGLTIHTDQDEAVELMAEIAS